jgi:hypothetical protein
MHRCLGPRDLRDNLGTSSTKDHQRARIVHDLALRYSLRRCVAVGLHKGLVTCYLGAAVGALGGGTVLSLSVRAHEEKAGEALKFIADNGLLEIVTIKYHPKSVGFLLIHEILSQPAEAVDLFYAHSGLTPETLALVSCAAERGLRPGGWFVLDSRDAIRPGDELMKSTPLESVRIEPAAIFQEFVGMSRCFSEFRRDGDLLMARKTCVRFTAKDRERNLEALMRAEVLARSSDNLRFRLLLKHMPEEAIDAVGIDVSINHSPVLQHVGDEPTTRWAALDQSVWNDLPETLWEKNGRVESEERDCNSLRTFGYRVSGTEPSA